MAELAITFESELRLAEQELGLRGDLQHGAHHLAQLLSMDPGRREGLDLLTKYLEKVQGDESKLYPNQEKRFFTEEAVRACAWARKGRIEDAISLLIQVVHARPNSIYLEEWAMDWLSTKEALDALSPTTVEHLLALVANRYPESRNLRPRLRRHLEKFERLAARVAPAKQSSPGARMMRAGLLRKLGRFDDALRFAQELTRTHPGWHAYAAEGLILRELGDLPAAVASFRKALEYDPEDLSARLEAADGFLNHRAWQEALEWYEEVLQREPNHEWAHPSALYCRWKADGEPRKRELLVRLARAHPPNRRAAQLLGLGSPYLGFLPAPEDATANALRSMTKSFQTRPPENGDSLTLNLGHLESPSATLAMQEQFKALRRRVTVKLKIRTVPAPDPRVPCEPVRYLLWSYQGTDSMPGLPPPSKRVVAAVASLADSPYDYHEDWQEAARLARGLSDQDIPDLLATMVHPPAIPDGQEALSWLPRVQLLAAKIIANMNSDWNHSHRREALFSALFGARDWTTTAAIIALARLGSDDEQIAGDVAAAFKKLESAIPDGRYCCFAHALYSNWQLLAGIPFAEIRRLQEQLLALEE
jgi:tetratricopeptide (TPR) repeat protein